MANEPYCSNCGYNLSGLTESSKCPECGQPLVEILTRNPARQGWGKRYRSEMTLFGLPLIDVAVGPTLDSPKGKARGIIAIGDQAVGLVAFGGVAMGLIAFGGLGLGFFAMGGMALGVFAAGGWGIGGFAFGGGALGLLAVGGGAIGVIATGGGVVGYYAGGGGAWGKYILTAYQRDPEAVEMFTRMKWLFGSGTPVASMLTPASWLALVLVSLLLLVAILVGWAYLRQRRAVRG